LKQVFVSLHKIVEPYKIIPERIRQNNCMMEDMIQATTKYDSHSARDDDSLYVASKCWERVIDAAVKVEILNRFRDSSF